MPRIRGLFPRLLLVTAAGGLVGWVAIGLPPGHLVSPGLVASLDSKVGRDLGTTVDAVDRLFQARWTEARVSPTGPADELQVLRRLSLALVGTIPSLAEIREFEEDRKADRLRRWTIRLLADRRFAEYFAERLAVAFVGDSRQRLPWFSHSRFETWLADQLESGSPYDEIVRAMISEVGPPTSNGGANFITAEIVPNEGSANRLAARTARVALGQRIDCAECHDHPFDTWKQSDFQGLAAYFAQVRTGAIGLEDNPRRRHEVEDRGSLEKRVVEARVPFRPEWLGEQGSRRVRLAGWVTHPQNRRFLRAITNRVWGLLFGRSYVAPVDSIPDPLESREGEGTDGTELLNVLSDDLQEHGGDLRRLVLVIASSSPFRLSSTDPEGVTATESERLANEWAVFPLARLRPEQVARSLEQAASLRALRADENVSIRVRRELWMRKVLDPQGSLGEDELAEQTDSISRAIQRMQGPFTREKSRAGWTNAVGRISAIAPDDKTCLETCYLVCLSRRPTAVEREHFLTRFRDAGARNRARVVEDLFWTLFNSPEFSWNH